jgi:hypothetical protein
MERLRSLRVFCKDPAESLQVPADPANPVLVVGNLVMALAPEVLLAMRTRPAPGEGWVDPGRRRSVGGEQVHPEWNQHLHTLGLKPKTAGFYPSVDNLPPTSEKILEKLIYR